MLTGDNLRETAQLTAGFDDEYYLTALALGKRIASRKEYIDLEAEGQIAKHFNGQDHMELNGLIVVRWLPFLWDDYIDTSFAIGNGLSYATDTPEIERLNHDETSQLLYYLMFEITFSMPDTPRWSLITRIHHRSGFYGLFNGVHGASNALGIGMRYNF